MRIHNRTTLLGLRLALAIAAAGIIGIACGGSGGETLATGTQALGSCGPGLMPNGEGGCTACSTTSPGSLTDTNLDQWFKFLEVQTAFDANNNPTASFFEITNGVGQFVPPPPTFISIPAPPPQSISIPGYSGSNYQVVVTSIPSIVVTWGPWSGGASGVTFEATMNGAIGAHLTYDVPPVGTPQIGVDVTVNISQLPMTITFNTDTSGNATLAASGVQISDFTSDVSVSGCSVEGIPCNSIADGFIGNAEPTLQSVIASQFSGALNGPKNATPFWRTLMTALANQGELQDGNNTSYNLPAQGTSSAAGTVSGWAFQSMDTITSTTVTGNFTSAGICYVGCTSMTVAQACSAVPCGTSTDGCGNTVDCPNTCPSGFVCDNNSCVVPGGCDPACPSGYICDYGNAGAPGVCVVNHRCVVGYHFCDNKCVPGTGLCP